MYRKKYNQTLNWEKVEERQINELHALYQEELAKGNKLLSAAFADVVYIIMFYENAEAVFSLVRPASLSFAGSEKSVEPGPSVSIHDMFQVPMIWNIMWVSSLYHYFLHQFAGVNAVLSAGDEDISDHFIDEMRDRYASRNPFYLYYINFSWEYYSRDFLTVYEADGDESRRSVRLAVFIMNAAKASLVAGLPCEGKTWGKLLRQAEDSPNLRVRLAVTLYHLCNFHDRHQNEPRLRELLTELKRDYPEEYNVLGIVE